MKSIRLKYCFSLDHCEIPAGTVIAVPADLAGDFVARGVAEFSDPEYAVVEPEETRIETKIKQPMNKYRRASRHE